MDLAKIKFRRIDNLSSGMNASLSSLNKNIVLYGFNLYNTCEQISTEIGCKDLMTELFS